MAAVKGKPAVQVALVVAALALVAIAGFLLLVRPRQAEASELEAKLADLETQLVVRSSAAAAPPEADAAELVRLAQAMPDRLDMPGLLLELNRVAAKAGVVLQSVVPGDAGPGQGYLTQPLELQFQGNFRSLLDFVRRLRGLVEKREGAVDARGRLFSVQSVSFAEGPRRFPQLLASLTVNAFVFGDQGLPPAAAPPVAPEPDPNATEATG